MRKLEEEVTAVQQGLESDLDVLKRISALDVEIGKLRSYEADIPLQISREEKKFHEAQEAARSLEEKIQSLNKELRDGEGEVTGLRDQIAQRRSKLCDVKTNKEYSALLSEIAAIDEKITASEERQIAVMEALEGQGAELETKKRELAQEVQKFEEVKKQKGLEKVRLQDALEDELAKKLDAYNRLDPKISQLYDRLVAAGKRDAVIAYRSQACQACFARITPQEEVLLKRGKDIITCSQCSRILFWGEE